MVCKCSLCAALLGGHGAPVCCVVCVPLRVAPLTGLGDMGRRFSFVRRRSDAPRPAVDSTSENPSVRVSDVLGAVPGQLTWSDPPLAAPVSCFGDDTTAGSGLQGGPGGSQLSPFPLTRPTAVRSDWQRAPAKSSPTTVRAGGVDEDALVHVRGDCDDSGLSMTPGHGGLVPVDAHQTPPRDTGMPMDSSTAATRHAGSAVGQRDRSMRVQALTRARWQPQGDRMDADPQAGAASVLSVADSTVTSQ
jgi:hypothetical protein